MPIGSLVSVVCVAWCTLCALAPMRRNARLGMVSFVSGFLVVELPALAFVYLVASTVPVLDAFALTSPVAVLALALTVASIVGLAVVARREWRARGVVEHALDGRMRRCSKWRALWIVLTPFGVGTRGVDRIANVAYGDAGRQNRLDVYRRRSGSTKAPVFIHLHGGRFVRGHKSREARALLYRLAGRGWVCVSANYRLRPAAAFPDYLVDTKTVIAWAREHAAEYGADARVVVVAGSSAGAHLAAMAALTANERALQPGFEDADTSVAAAVCLYGYYGSLDDAPVGRQSSPRELDAGAAPPFFLVHGDHDSVVLVEGARRFVDHLQRSSRSPVVYAELPGAQHGFDMFRSIRFEAVVDGIETFLDRVVAQAPVS